MTALTEISGSSSSNRTLDFDITLAGKVSRIPESFDAYPDTHRRVK
jgi:hypothetical protein